MRYDLSILDYEKEITEQLKLQHTEMVKELYDNLDNKKIDKDDYIMLYHGTNLRSLNSILIDGMLTRNITKVSNFNDVIISNEHLVYMTNKWHYFYAFNSFLLDVNSQDTMNIPSYVEVKVPKALLVEDEDFFHSKYVKSKIKRCLKKNERYLEISWEECLAQYGTVAVIGKIPREYLFSFTILADLELFQKNFASEDCQYSKEVVNWGNSKGKGKLKFMDLVKLESSDINATYFMDSIPENNIIKGAFINDSGMLSLQLEEIMV